MDAGSSKRVSMPFGKRAPVDVKEASGEVKSAQELKVGERIREVRKAKRIRQKVSRANGRNFAGCAHELREGTQAHLAWIGFIVSPKRLDTPVAYFLPDEKDKSRATPGDPRERPFAERMAHARQERTCCAADFPSATRSLGSGEGNQESTQARFVTAFRLSQSVISAESST